MSTWQIVQPGGFGASLEDELLAELDNQEKENKKNKSSKKKFTDHNTCSSEEDDDSSDDDDEEEPSDDEKEEDDKQAFEYLCVLDFEAVRERVADQWLYEVSEFPVTLFNCSTLQVEDRFHRYCNPARVSPDVMQCYINNKYGPLGLAEEWKNAVSFETALRDLEHWLEDKGLLPPVDGKEGKEFRFAFVTCGDWDIKNMLPRNCDLLGIPVPYFMKQWINIKAVYQHFYHTRRPPSGMTTMLRALQIPLEGTHHVGKDDANNITKIAKRMISEGCKFFITGHESDMWHSGQRVEEGDDSTSTESA